MVTRIFSVVSITIILLICGGCIGSACGITYSFLPDRIEDGEVVVIVYLELGRGESWFGPDAKQKATEVAERIARFELQQRGIKEYLIGSYSYTQFRQNSHRVGIRIKERSGRLAKSLGLRSLGSLKEGEISSLNP